MSGFFEKLVNALFSMSSGYASIRAHHQDDWLTAEFKGLQRAAVASLVYLALALAVSCLVAGGLSAVMDNALLGPLIISVREPLGMVIFGVLGLLSLNLAYSFGALYLFGRKHGQD